MSDTGTRTALNDDDLRVLIGILAGFETTYLVDDPVDAVHAMKERFRKDRRRYGLTAEIQDDREALWRLNVRVRNALGEKLSPDGSPER